MATGNIIENLVKFGRVVLEICVPTDRQTRSSQHSAAPIGAE